MNVQVHAKDITLNSNTRAHIESAIESFTKYSLDITSVNVHVNAEKQARLDREQHIIQLSQAKVNYLTALGEL